MHTYITHMHIHIYLCIYKGAGLFLGPRLPASTGWARRLERLAVFAGAQGREEPASCLYFGAGQGRESPNAENDLSVSDPRQY